MFPVVLKAQTAQLGEGRRETTSDWPRSLVGRNNRARAWPPSGCTRSVCWGNYPIDCQSPAEVLTTTYISAYLFVFYLAALQPFFKRLDFVVALSSFCPSSLPSSLCLQLHFRPSKYDTENADEKLTPLSSLNSPHNALGCSSPSRVHPQVHDWQGAPVIDFELRTARFTSEED